MIQIVNRVETEKFVVKYQKHIVYTKRPSGSYLNNSLIQTNKGTGNDLANDFLEVVIENNSENSFEKTIDSTKASLVVSGSGSWQ